MDYPISNHDIYNILGEDTRIFKYRQLSKFKTIEELFATKDFVIILYETKKDFGHWCCILWHKKRNTIEHFDSYGLMPDDELKFVPDVFRKINNMMVPHLTALLYNSKKKIEFSEFELQSQDTQTCGRWVLFRIVNMHNMNIYKFKNMFIDKKFKPDELIYLFTNYIYNI